jgi:hypothetical protein
MRYLAEVICVDNGNRIGVGVASEIPDAVRNAFRTSLAEQYAVGEYHVEVHPADDDQIEASLRRYRQEASGSLCGEE